MERVSFCTWIKDFLYRYSFIYEEIHDRYTYHYEEPVYLSPLELRYHLSRVYIKIILLALIVTVFYTVTYLVSEVSGL